jgi:predicted nucleic acid-binding protein
MSYLVDTNVLSESTRANPDPRVLAWLREHEHELFVSVITAGELQRGVALYPQSRKRQRLERWLEELLAAFEGRILPVDRKVAQEWGHYYAAQQQAGRKPPSLDSLVAATAKVYQLTVVSRNAADFPDVPVVNPWENPER